MRAVTPPSFWRLFSANRRSGREVSSPPQLAAQLCKPINKKAKKYSSQEKATLVLVLDATRAPAHTMGAVVDEFRRANSAWCARAGFQAVWIVGPFSNMVSRIDVSAV